MASRVRIMVVSSCVTRSQRLDSSARNAAAEGPAPQAPSRRRTSTSASRSAAALAASEDSRRHNASSRPLNALGVGSGEEKRPCRYSAGRKEGVRRCQALR